MTTTPEVFLPPSWYDGSVYRVLDTGRALVLEVWMGESWRVVPAGKVADDLTAKTCCFGSRLSPEKLAERGIPA